jgi:UDP-GlcNAc:undecaprenyl-phosphate/decaprenyl-phosphate GlcNAc-1-phosphate transferase
MLYLLVFFSSLIITIFSTPFLINFLTRLNIVDLPGGRRINTAAIPRMGGILIYGIVVLTLLNYTKDYTIFRFIIMASGLLALCGVLDDLKSLGWKLKYLLHSISAVVILLYIYPITSYVELFGTYIPFPFDIIILFFLITGAINALNLLDGMDGLVTGFSLLLFMLIFILSFSIADPFLMILSAAAIGSLIGFLKFNANPARIFLGDTGSLILGFFLIVSALLFTHGYYRGVIDIGFPIILLGVPLIDTLRVMTIRIWNGKSPFHPDKSHIHHMISGNNIRHKTTVFIIQAFTVFFIVLSLIYIYYDKFTGYLLFCLSGTLLFNLSVVMNLLRRLEGLKRIVRRLPLDNIFTIDLYKRYLLPFSAVTVAGVIFLLFPGDIKLPADIILLMIIICSLLFLASWFSTKREKQYNDLYVLLNLLIFFSLTNMSQPWMSSAVDSDWGSQLILWSAAGSLLGVIGLFLITKDRLFRGGRTLLTGLDMIMLVMLILLMVLYNIIQIPEIRFVDENLILGFTIYIWYKIAMFIMPRLLKPVYYLTFAVPLVTLIILSM